MPLPYQYQLILKILTFDRNLKIRAKKEIVMGIVYQKALNESLHVKDKLAKAMEESSFRELEGIPIRYVAVEFRDKNDFALSLIEQNVNLLYITPLPPASLKKILSICRTKQIPTLSGTPSFIESGVAVGFRSKEGRPEILINIRSAKEQGFNFSSRLLYLARIFGTVD